MWDTRDNGPRFNKHINSYALSAFKKLKNNSQIHSILI